MHFLRFFFFLITSQRSARPNFCLQNLDGLLLVSDIVAKHSSHHTLLPWPTGSPLHEFICRDGFGFVAPVAPVVTPVLSPPAPVLATSSTPVAPVAPVDASSIPAPVAPVPATSGVGVGVGAAVVGVGVGAAVVGVGVGASVVVAAVVGAAVVAEGLGLAGPGAGVVLGDDVGLVQSPHVFLHKARVSAAVSHLPSCLRAEHHALSR